MAKKKSESRDKKSWIVRVRRVSTVEIFCGNCTRDEAENNLYEHSQEEREIDVHEEEVISVEEDS